MLRGKSLDFSSRKGSTLSFMSVKTKNNKQVYDKGTPNEVVVVRTMLELPEAVYDAYAEQALKAGKETETLLEQRLNKCQGHADQGLFFNDAQAKRLFHVLGKTVSDAEGALQRLETICLLDVGDVKIEVEPRILQRLKSRVFRGQTLEGVIRKEVLMGLKRFCGLEPS